MEISIEDEIKNTSMNAPHVVILGAGASLAAFINGDRNGRILPLMNNFVEVLGLKSDLEDCGIEYENRNFEVVFDELYKDVRHKDKLSIIESKIRNYLSQLFLPDQPTIYDHLVLSLRKKDLIATFNWDPLLYSACYRNHKKIDLPHVVYLHGNVAIGCCLKDKIKGCNGYNCHKCGKRYTPSKLLFPIREKRYTDDPFIKAEWETLQAYLKKAFLVTIFGYNAPKSDIEAIGLMKDAWGRWEDRQFEQFEIIDIKEEEELVETWDDFIHTHHYEVKKDFYESLIAKHPRRTCEAMWSQNMEAKFINTNNIPKDYDFPKLLEWYEPLKGAEEAKE